MTFVAVTYHLVIDLRLGLYGEISDEMSFAEGAWGLATSTLLGWWLISILLGVTGHAPALRSTLILSAVVGVLLNGIVAIVVAPPPSDAYPWQDIAHFTALVAGFLATWTTRREIRHRQGLYGGPDARGSPAMVIITFALIIASSALGVPLTLDALRGG